MQCTHKAITIHWTTGEWSVNCRCGREGQTAYATKREALAGYARVRCG